MPKLTGNNAEEIFVSSSGFDFTKTPDMESPPVRRCTKYLPKKMNNNSTLSSLKRLMNSHKSAVRTPRRSTTDSFLRLFNDSSPFGSTKEKLFDWTLTNLVESCPKIHVLQATPENPNSKMNETFLRPPASIPKLDTSKKYRTSTPFDKGSVPSHPSTSLWSIREESSGKRNIDQDSFDSPWNEGDRQSVLIPEHSLTIGNIGDSKSFFLRPARSIGVQTDSKLDFDGINVRLEIDPQRSIDMLTMTTFLTN